MKLFVFGLGYTAGYYAGHEGRALESVVGTVRTEDRVAQLRSEGMRALRCDGRDADPALPELIAGCDALLVSAQPDGQADPALSLFADAIAASGSLKTIVYLSTIGVYGDHGGAWIDETTGTDPVDARKASRINVERDWLDFATRTGKRVIILRLAGIYGPGRNALLDLRSGEARRIDKPGQVFNRIHVADIARAIDAALRYRGPQRIFNVTDDEPASAPDVVAYAAGLMGREPPPLVPFAEAGLSPMALSFYGANRRVRNDALKRELGVELAYPDYRRGLDALWAASTHPAP